MPEIVRSMASRPGTRRCAAWSRNCCEKASALRSSSWSTSATSSTKWPHRRGVGRHRHRAEDRPSPRSARRHRPHARLPGRREPRQRARPNHRRPCHRRRDTARLHARSRNAGADRPLRRRGRPPRKAVELAGAAAVARFRNSMGYQDGQPLPGHAPAEARSARASRISRRKVTVPFRRRAGTRSVSRASIAGSSASRTIVRWRSGCRSRTRRQACRLHRGSICRERGRRIPRFAARRRSRTVSAFRRSRRSRSIRSGMRSRQERRPA